MIILDTFFVDASSLFISCGLWPAITCDILTRCLADRSEKRDNLFCFTIKNGIKSVFYSIIVLIIIFCVAFPGIEIIPIFILVIIEHNYSNGMLIRCKKSTVYKIEQKICCCS